MIVSPSPVWAFADETGDVGHTPGSSRYLIVAIVLTRSPRLLRKAVTKTRKHLRKKLRNVPELKAWHTPKKVVARFLRYITELDVEIVAVVLDKHTASARPDSEDWYRLTCAEAVHHCVERYTWLKLAVDRRYTNENLRDRLEQSFLVRATSTSERTTVGLIRIEHSDSVQEKGIQAADAVVWSLGQKYERGDDELYTSSRTRSSSKRSWRNRKTGSPWRPILTVHARRQALVATTEYHVLTHEQPDPGLTSPAFQPYYTR